MTGGEPPLRRDRGRAGTRRSAPDPVPAPVGRCASARASGSGNPGIPAGGRTQLSARRVQTLIPGTTRDGSSSVAARRIVTPVIACGRDNGVEPRFWQQTRSMGSPLRSGRE